MRLLRAAVTAAITLVGLAVVFLAVLGMPEAEGSTRAGIALFGVALIEAGAWRRANPFLPNERRFHELRAEVDSFIGLVRRLNQAALRTKERGLAAGEEESLILSAMHESVDEMGALAGMTTPRPDHEDPGRG